MSKKMLVESDPHQTRIAILESDRLTEIFIERKHRLGIVGNIYKGRVTRVLPGMQAAFVDIGLERDAFLYVRDVGRMEFEEEDGNGLSTIEELESSIRDQSGDRDDLNANNGLGRDDEGVAATDRGDEEQTIAADLPSIDDLLKNGQELIVQVTKDALPNKGPRVTTHVTLPSRYLVLLPTVNHIGVSRRIEEEDERERLREILEPLAGPSEGLIVRTAGAGREVEEFRADRDYLQRHWQRVRSAGERVSAPTLLHRDLNLALRVVRDLFSAEYSVLWVDEEDTYQRIVEFLDQVQPALVGKVRLDRQEAALFERFDIEGEIESALSSKVWLKSGGYLVINQTEALVAIDVNTGRYVGQQNLEDTVRKINLEAVREIVRQIRLRDLSGILILDLIDMTEEVHRDEVFEALENELKKDRAKSKVLKISEFGLVEITRKRSHANLERLLTIPCPYCAGKGRISSISTICLNIRGEVLRQARRRPMGEFLLRVHPEVASALQQQERAILDELQRTVGSDVLLQSDADLHHERFDITQV